MTASKVTLAAFLHELASRHTKADIERSKQRDHRFQKIFPIVTTLLILGIVVLAILYKMPDILNHYQHRDWSGLVNDLSSFLFVVIVASLLLYNSLKKEEEKPSLAEKLLGFRESLGDERLILPVEEQPALLEEAELPLTLVRVGPIRRWKSDVVAMAVIMLFFLSIDVLIILMAVATFYAGQPLATIMLVSLLVLPITSIIGAMPLLAWWRFRSHRVTVDMQGLRWEPPIRLKKRQTVALAWEDIDAFYVIQGQDDPGKCAKAYVLNSSKGMFYWPVFERSRPQERQASIYLMRLIATRTRLPLRDLTKVVEPLLEDHQDASTTKKMESYITIKNLSKRRNLL